MKRRHNLCNERCENMRIIDRIHEILIRRIDINNPDSDYYEIYPITTADNVYMTIDQDESLSEFLFSLRFQYNVFVDNLTFPVIDVSVYNGNTLGSPKTGHVVLRTADFGLGLIDNTADINKPVSQAQEDYMNGKIQDVIDYINVIITNKDLWSQHVTGGPDGGPIRGNPHKTSWKDVINNENINIDPRDLVDSIALRDAIDKHNDDKDSHEVLSKIIDGLATDVQGYEDRLTVLENSINSRINAIIANLLSVHNTSFNAHPDIIAALAQVRAEIDQVIIDYSGLNGMEYTVNKTTELNMANMLQYIRSKNGGVVTAEALSDPNLIAQYKDQYPSVTAIRKLLAELDVNGYMNVEYIATMNDDDIDLRVAANNSGIIFSDNYIHSLGASHVAIVVYKFGQVISKLNMPKPINAINFRKMDDAPNQTYMMTNYPNESTLIFCQRSTANTNKQSIVMWSNGIYNEYILDVFKLIPGEHVWMADATQTNVGYNFATNFVGGYGLLVVNDLNGTGKAGVVIYNKDLTPNTKAVEFSVKNNAVLMIESAANPTAAQIPSLLPDGTGLVYVNNMNGSSTPGIEYWLEGVRKISKPFPKNGYHTQRLTVTGNGSTQSQNITLPMSFLNTGSMKASGGLCGINTNNVITSSIRAEVTVTVNGVNSITVQTTVTNGVSASFYINVMGLL